MVDVEASFVADGEAAEAVQPGEGPLDHPAVTAELLAGLDTASCDAGLDASSLAGPTASTKVVGLVGVELRRPSSGPASLTADRRNSIQQFIEGFAVVDVGSGQKEGERDALPVGDEVALGPRSAAVGRIGASRLTPLLAATDELSRQARLQSAGPPGANGAAVRGAVGPRRLPPANPAAAASMSPRSRTPSLAAASPTVCRFVARTGCQSAQPGRRRADGRLWAWQARPAAKARPATTGRRKQEGQACHLMIHSHQSTRVLKGSLSHSSRKAHRIDVRKLREDMTVGGIVVGSKATQITVGGSCFTPVFFRLSSVCITTVK